MSSIWLSISTLELKMVILVPLELDDDPHAPSMPTVISVATIAVPAFFQEENLLIFQSLSIHYSPSSPAQ
jgi:hypothetical protein